MDIEKQVRELIEYLNARTLEYDLGKPTISDKEWDDKYFKLLELEKELGYTFNDSPTQTIEYRVVNSLEKVEHSHKMLSLDKTKDVDEVKKFLGKQEYIAMLKMDGLTCSLTYENGRLIKAETRGNGVIGENILHNARVVMNIPNNIPHKERVVIDGEIICDKETFTNFSTEYKNPRNFAAGSIRLLDAKECYKRGLSFIAWDVIEGLDQYTQLSSKLKHLEDQWYFTIVPFGSPNEEETVDDCIEYLTIVAEQKGYPIDGLVFKFDDIAYGKSLGETAHHFKNAIAYKFYDETAWTKLIDIEWGAGRTGVLTPVAIFEPVELDGSTIERASLHNISIIKELFGLAGPHCDQEVEVFKSNAIIPQIKSVSNADTLPKGTKINIPNYCPICGARTEIKCDNNSEFLYCINPECGGKLINQLVHFCGKKGLDIKGLSEATLQKLIDWGWVTNRASILSLATHESEWITKPGFGEKSVNNILEAIAKTRRECELSAFISSLGIPLVGTTVSKDLAKHFKSWTNFREAIENKFYFWALPNIGFEIHSAIRNFDYSEADYMANYWLNIKDSIEEIGNSNLSGQSFVITGKLNQFKNRDELKAKIERAGGKVVGSISSKTNYLINNDIESTSSKNLAAKKLNIPIISEENFIELFNIH